MKQIWLHFCCHVDTLLVSVRLFGFVITLIFLIVQIVNQKKKKDHVKIAEQLNEGK